MKKIIIFLLCTYSVTGCFLFDNSKKEHSAIKAKNLSLQTNENDNRKYRSILLPNGLQALLISDPSTDQAAAAMNVNVGYFNDPEHRPGLAHFLEHMLFLGTKKYPDPKNYAQYLAQHTGFFNAYTAKENTCYFFAINKNYLKGSLDRFAQFFIEPLFNENLVQREINAINSEHQKNLQSDQYRIYQVLQTLVNPKHPFHKFGTGNLTTLQNRSSHNQTILGELKKIYRQHYSAQNMKLVILGKESLDKLEKLAKLFFTAVPKRNVKLIKYPEELILKQQFKKYIQIKPIQNIRLLKLVFPFPSLRKYYETKPDFYIAHLLGHEGQGSLLSFLKQKGWVTSLSAGATADSKNFSLFMITMELTEHGLKNTQKIIAAVFQTIKLIQEQGIKFDYFKELQTTNQIDFQFKDKEEPINYVTALADRLHYLPTNLIVTAPWQLKNFNRDLIQQFLQRLNPDQMLAFQINPGVLTNRIEPWYQTSYSIKNIPQKQLQKWKKVQLNPQITLPKLNPFLPQNLTIKSTKSAKTDLSILEKTNTVQVWFKQDQTFKIPKANYFIKLITPESYRTAKNAALTELLVCLIENALNEYAYQAQIAGLNYAVTRSIEGLQIIVSGYNDKLPFLLKTIFQNLKELKIERKNFLIYKEKIKRQHLNAKLDKAYLIAAYENYYFLNKPLWHHDDYLKEIDNLTIKQLKTFHAKIFTKLHYEFLVHGNVNVTETKALIDDIKKILPPVSIPQKEIPQSRTRQIAVGKNLVVQKSVHDNNSAIKFYFQIGKMDDHKTALITLLSAIIEKPFYHELRTIQQLGYIVDVNYEVLNRIGGISFIIQSAIKDPIFLQKQIQKFLQKFKTTLAQMTTKEIMTYQKTLAAQLLEPPKSLGEETARYFNEIDKKTYDFKKLERIAKAILLIKAEELVKFYQQIFITKPKSLSVKIFGRDHPLN